MQEIKAVLFDLDDTLWPIVPVIQRAEQLLFEWLQRNAPEVARQFSVASLRERRMALAESNPRYRFDMTALRHAGLVDAFRHCNEDCANVDAAMAIFVAARNTVDLFDDVDAGLRRIGQHWKLGAVTNGPADLHAIGISAHFDVTVAAHKFGHPKPDPAIFHAACDALNINPQQAVYVGDDPLLDVEAAQCAGLRAVWLHRAMDASAKPMPSHIKPDAICADLFEVEQWLHSSSGTTLRRSLK